MYPRFLINKQIKLFLNNKLSKNDTPKKTPIKKMQHTTKYHTLVTYR